MLSAYLIFTGIISKINFTTTRPASQCPPAWDNVINDSLSSKMGDSPFIPLLG